MKYFNLAILSATYGFTCRQLEIPLTNSIGVMLFIAVVVVVFMLTPSRKSRYKPRYRLPKKRATTMLRW